MKNSFFGPFVVAITLAATGCDSTADDTVNTDHVEPAKPAEPVAPEPGWVVSAEADSCLGPNVLFGDECCSLEGTWGGSCSVDRYWESAGGCTDEHVVDGLQYCCGGKFLASQGARGFQCLAE